MLLRHNGCFIAWLAVFFIMISASTAWSQEKSNYFQNVIHFYQEYISPADGDRCTMYPSCSRYLEKCVKKHGLLTGWVMGLDRLVRCGRDEVKNSSPVWIKGRRYTYDPVENNDFWWSDK